MTDRADQKLREAEELRARLIAEGRHRDAEIIRALAATYRASRRANALLHADNQALKEGKPAGGAIDMDYPARARAKIAEIHAALPADATYSMRVSALKRGYPFGERRYWPYQAWLQERAKYLRQYDPATPLGPLLEGVAFPYQSRAA
ncbi:hypothetical protein [Sphingopyxis sp. 113P3]|uniref:hypothetical protein n=1 Tax=Sphingopyxis sp. (strain 113P3) TaxID=292913 RepID=UPI0006AD441C|nr:hypothetical protein [Sphingopyxis sp. 113P3]